MLLENSFLKLKDYGTDYDNRVAKTLQIVLYALFIGTIVGVGITIYDDDWAGLIGVIVSGLIVVASIAIMHSGNIKLPSRLMPLLAIGLGFYLSVTGSGVRSTSIVLIFLGIIIAALLGARYSLRVYSALAVGSLIAMYILEVMGYVGGVKTGFDDLLEISTYFILGGLMLAQLVNNLMKTLEKSRKNEHALAVLNEELEARVEARTAELAKAKEEAEAARDKALEADRIKSQFLASMSHELRTPLNSILTFSELLAMEAFGPVTEEQKDYLGKTLGSGRHLLALINDVLDITKLNSGMMQMHVEENLDLSAEIDAALATAESLLVSKPGVELITEIAPSIPLVTGDRRRIKQVMLNLVSNACKFTEKGQIIIRVRQDADQQFLFQVEDTGPGIPAGQHEVIFDPFVQTDTGIKHAGGTGLGLPISKRLVEEHHGTMMVASEKGKGATFTFTLPATIKEVTHAV